MHKQDATEDAAKAKRPKGEQGVQMKQGVLCERRKTWMIEMEKGFKGIAMMQNEEREPLMAYPLSAQICQLFLKMPEL